MKIPRDTYASLYGPTTGDRVRLGDTNLFLEVERDFATYGEEVVFGGGKVIRDGQGQSQTSRADGAPDLVITNAIVLDYWGVVKADVGVRDGRICAIGKAGNPDIQDNVTPGLAIGPVDGDHRGRTSHPDRGRHRRAHPLHQPAAGVGGALQRDHHHDRRRHGTGRRHAGDDLHARGVEPAPDDRGDAEPADERRLSRQGQRRHAGLARGAGPRRRDGLEAARGLGHDAGGHRYGVDRCRRVRRAGRHPYRYAQRVRLRRAHDRGVQGTDDSHLPQRGGRRRPRARHPARLRRSRTSCPRARTRRCPTP